MSSRCFVLSLILFLGFGSQLALTDFNSSFSNQNDAESIILEASFFNTASDIFTSGTSDNKGKGHSCIIAENEEEDDKHRTISCPFRDYSTSSYTDQSSHLKRSLASSFLNFDFSFSKGAKLIPRYLFIEVFRL